MCFVCTIEHITQILGSVRGGGKPVKDFFLKKKYFKLKKKKWKERKRSL